MPTRRTTRIARGPRGRGDPLSGTRHPSGEEEILAVIEALLPGEVVSYGDVAEVAGLPGRARFVGRLLALSDRDLPWWRVVTSDGRLVPGAEDEQSNRLRAERVLVAGNRVREAPLGRFSRARRSPT